MAGGGHVIKPKAMRASFFSMAVLLVLGGCAHNHPPVEAPSHAHDAERPHAPAPSGSRPSESFRAEHVEILHHLDATSQRAAALMTAKEADVNGQIQAIVGFFQNELMPHAQAEEAVLYGVADRLIPTKAPYRYTDSLRYEHTEVHAAVEEMASFAKSADRSPQAVTEFSRLAIATAGLVRGHFGAEENVILDALDRLMTPEEFQREVVEPTIAYVRKQGGGHHHHDH